MQPNHGPPQIQDSCSSVDFLTHQLLHRQLGLHRNAGEFHNSLLQPWLHLQDSAPTKEPFWKPRLENEEQRFHGNKIKDENDDLQHAQKHLGELEAVCSQARASMATQQVPNINDGSENLDREEVASLRKTRKRRKLKENLSSMVEFIERLAKQLMNHQEMLQRNFLQVIDRMEKEQTKREEERRCEEAERYRRESISRAQERSLASHREAQIVSYLEKITGQSVDISARKIQETGVQNKESA